MRGFQGLGAGRNGELLLMNDHNVSVWGNKYVLEINNGDGYATLYL